MELMDKYYASLKEATHYLDNVKRNYNEQKCSYNIIAMHIKKIKNNEEKLGDYLNNINELIEKQMSHLGKCLIADIIIFLVIGAFVIGLLSLSTPITLACSVVSSILYFSFAHNKGLKKVKELKQKRDHLNETMRSLGEKKADINLVELEQNLEKILSKNEETIANLEEAIDHYLTILMDYESKILPYGKEIVSEENTKPLDDELKRLDLSYKGDGFNGNN